MNRRFVYYIYFGVVVEIVVFDYCYVNVYNVIIF